MRWSRRLRYLLEYALARLAFAVFGALPLDAASALGGRLGRLIGPRLALSRRARDNLVLAMPELSRAEHESVVAAMWEHLGRVLAEYPHLGALRLYDGDGRVEVIGAEHVDALRDDGIGGIFFSGHIGNWEIASLGATQRGMPVVHVYRTANNPRIDRLIRRARAPIGGEHHPKSARGMRALVGALRRGEHLGMLVDQKYNEGIAVPFFGREAMTAPALAELALRYRVPVVPVRVERLAGARFRLTVLPPLDLPDSGDREADVRAAMRRVNALFEEWIRARPEQWLWLHRRWPDDDQT
jgi:KDO2-lipid IV(A) lauroyltransferase